MTKYQTRQNEGCIQGRIIHWAKGCYSPGAPHWLTVGWIFSSLHNFPKGHLHLWPNNTYQSYLTGFSAFMEMGDPPPSPNQGVIPPCQGLIHPRPQIWKILCYLH